MAIEINGLPQNQAQSSSEKGQVDVARSEPTSPERRLAALTTLIELKDVPGHATQSGSDVPQAAGSKDH